MRHVACAAVFLLVSPIAFAGHQHAMTAPGRVSPCKKLDVFAPAVPNPAFQNVKWTVPGVTDKAQQFFSQGMTQYYGFNYEEALRNFRAASAANLPSKKMAMASWGIALAAGPNINLGMDRDCHLLAKTESENAKLLASNSGGATAAQKALIDALPKRYAYDVPPVGEAASEDKVKDALKNYSEDLAKNWEKFKYDTNYGALYAESLIELHPWALFDNHYKPTSEDTNTIINVLKTAIAANGDGVGANHFYIHTAEAGPRPRNAMKSANVLPTLAPMLGHLVHMPSPIYLLTGNYKKSLESNEKAAAVDAAEYKKCCSGSYNDYSSNPYCPQLYYGHYLSHNYFFGSVSATFGGRSEKAVKLACETRDHVQNFMTNEPNLQRYMTAPLMTLVVNRNWTEILKYPEPPPTCYMQAFENESGCYVLRAIWHWARGMALASRNVPDIARAKKEHEAMGKLMDEMPRLEPWGNNLAFKVLDIGRNVLEARYLWAEGKYDKTIDALRLAIVNEDELTYDEPPQWFTPVREALGGVLLRAAEHEQGRVLKLTTYRMARKIFNEELGRHKLSGRALYGKLRALKGIQKTGGGGKALSAEAAYTKLHFDHAWIGSDYIMTEEDLWPVIRSSLLSEPSQPQSGQPSKLSCTVTPWPAPLLACP